MRGDHDRHLARLAQKLADHLVPSKGIQAAERLIENEQLRVVGERARQGQFQTHSMGKLADSAARRQPQLGPQLLLQVRVPRGITRAQVVEKLTYLEPHRQRLALGYIAHLRQHRRPDIAAIDPEDARGAA